MVLPCRTANGFVQIRKQQISKRKNSKSTAHAIVFKVLKSALKGQSLFLPNILKAAKEHFFSIQSLLNNFILTSATCRTMALTYGYCFLSNKSHLGLAIIRVLKLMAYQSLQGRVSSKAAFLPYLHPFCQSQRLPIYLLCIQTQQATISAQAFMKTERIEKIGW